MGGQPEPHLPPAPVDGEKLPSPQSLPLDSGKKQQSFISHLQVNLSTIQVDSIQVYFFSKKQQDTSYGKGGRVGYVKQLRKKTQTVFLSVQLAETRAAVPSSTELEGK